MKINLLSERAQLSTRIYAKASQALETANYLNRLWLTQSPSPSIRREADRWLEAFHALERTFYRVVVRR